jgi:hypothetical protein
MNNPILDAARKWRSIGIDSMALKVEGEHRSKKLFKKTLRLTDKILDSHENIDGEYNFLGIILRGSGLICLDVEANTPESVPSFYKLLKDKEIDPESLLMEKSLNGGIHVYFRLGNLEIKTQHFKEFSGINFDILTSLRAFTSPSSFKHKRYEWIGSGMSKINCKEDIRIFPESLYFLLGAI